MRGWRKPLPLNFQLMKRKETSMTPEQIKECCYDIGNFPYEIPDTFGEDIVGKEFYTAKEERPRKVKLEITSFIGVCCDAVHYYGTLKAFRPHIKKEGCDGCFYGYLGEDTPLFQDLNIVIELWRYVTDAERKSDHKRYGDMEMTSGWYEKAQIIKFAKDVLNTRFKGDWKLTIEDLTR